MSVEEEKGERGESALAKSFSAAEQEGKEKGLKGSVLCRGGKGGGEEKKGSEHGSFPSGGRTNRGGTIPVTGRRGKKREGSSLALHRAY